MFEGSGSIIKTGQASSGTSDSTTPIKAAVPNFEFRPPVTPKIPTTLASPTAGLDSLVSGTKKNIEGLFVGEQAMTGNILPWENGWRDLGDLINTVGQGFSQAIAKFGVSTYDLPQSFITGGKVSSSAVPIPDALRGVLGESQITSYQQDAAQRINDGLDPVLAVGASAAQAVLDGWITAEATNEAASPLMNTLASNLPDELLYKMSELKLPVAEIMDYIVGGSSPSTGGVISQDTKDFVNGLDTKERISLWSMARIMSEQDTVTIQKTGDPTLLGKLLGVEPKVASNIIRTHPWLQLPGWADTVDPWTRSSMGVPQEYVGGPYPEPEGTPPTPPEGTPSGEPSVPALPAVAEDKFYMYADAGGEQGLSYNEVKGKSVDVVPGIDTFISHPFNDPKGWTITEAQTGLSVSGTFPTQQAAIADAKAKFELATTRGIDTSKAITDSVARNGLSPRYHQPTAPKTQKGVASSRLPDNFVPQGMKENVGEIKAEIQSYIDDLQTNNELEGLDFNIQDIEVTGSRSKGVGTKKSDLDALVEYTGGAREDDMFNALNRDPLKIDGVKVDINPIKAEKSGTIDEYKALNEKPTGKYAPKTGATETTPAQPVTTPTVSKTPAPLIPPDMSGTAGLEAVNLKPETSPLIARRESTLLNERMKALARGSRMGATATKAEIAATQQQLTDIINESDLPTDEKGKFLATVKNIQTQAQLAKALPDIENRIQTLTDTSLKKSLMADIKKELGANMYVGKGDARVSKYSPSVTRILESFKENLSSKDPNSLKMEELRLTQAWIAEHPEEEMPESVLESLDELQRTHLSLLTTSELSDQLQNIKDLKTQGKTFKSLKLGQIAREREKIINQFNGIITGGKGIGPGKPVVPSQNKPNFIKKWGDAAKESLFTRQLIADNIFDILDEKAGSPMYKGAIHDKFINLSSTARDARISGTQSTLKEISAALQKVKSTLNKEVDFGDGIKMTRNEMIDVYMRSFDPAQVESMIEGNKIPQDKIDKIISELTPEEKNVANIALNHWNNNYDAMNAVFKERHLFDMPRDVGYGYSPMPKDMEYVGSEDINLLNQQMDYLKASVPKGMTKARTGSLAPVKLGFVGNYADAVARTEHYKAYELPVQEMNAVLKGIKDAVVQERGIGYYKLLEEYVKKAANQGKYSRTYIEKALTTLRGNMSTGLLGLNLVTSVKHIMTSLGGALTEINELDLGKGVLSYLTNKSSWDALWDSVPQFAERASSATRELSEVAGTKSPIHNMLGKQNIRQKAMFLLSVGDKIVVRAEATAIYKRDISNGATEEQAIQAAVSKLRRTQTGGAPEDLPSLMSGGSLEKMLTMFSTEKNKYLNLLYGYSRAYSKGRIPFSSFSRTLFYTWIFNGLVMEETRTGGKATPKQLAEAVALGPLEDVLILGNLIEAARVGFSYDDSPMESMGADMDTYLKDIINGKWLAGLEGLGETVGTIAGLPITAAKKVDTGVTDILDGQTKDWRQLIWSPSALGETKKAKYASGAGTSGLPSLDMSNYGGSSLPSLDMSTMGMPSLQQ